MDAMARSVDNYWIADSGTYTFPAAVSITSVFGDTVTDTVNVASPTGAVTGKAQFPLSAAYEVVGGMYYPACRLCPVACSASDWGWTDYPQRLACKPFLRQMLC